MFIKSRLVKGLIPLFAAAMALLAVVSIVYAASLTVDTFDAGPQVSNIATPCTTATMPMSETIGAERNILINRTTGGGSVQADVDTSVPGSLAFSIGASTRGTALIQLDGSDGSCALNATGLGGLIFNPYDGLSLFVEQVDLNARVIMTIYTNASNYSTYTYTLPYAISAPGAEIYFPFNQFTPTGLGANFGNVGAVEILADGTTIDSLDMTLNFVSSDFTYDYGDLPPAYTNTLQVDNGARHRIGAIYLGSSIDSEPDGQESGATDGDDTGRSDDEQGITISASDPNWGDGTGILDVDITKPPTVLAACLVGWIDWNQNSVFDAVSTGGKSELVINTFVAFDGPTNITTPTVAEYGGTFANGAPLNARFRLFPSNDPLFTTYGLSTDGFGCPTGNPPPAMLQLVFGESIDGEVEDYQWAFGPTAVQMSNVESGVSDSGSNRLFVWLIGLALSLATMFVFYQRKKQLQ